MADAGEAALKRELYTSLRGAGVVNRLRTTLRAEIVGRLRRRESGWLADGDASVPPTLQRRIVDSLFVEYLRERGLEYTLSVFMPESGLPAEHALPRDDMVSLLGAHASAALAAPALEGPGGGEGALPDGSLATCLVAAMHKQYSAAGDASTQTDDLDVGGRVERELEAVERMYEARKAAEATVPFAALEQRMAEYQAECDRRVKEEVAAGVDRVRQIEVGAARIAEAEVQRKALEARREELDRVAAERLKTLHEREEAAADRLKRKEREMEARAAEHRAHIVSDKERLRAREEELAREAQLQRQLQDAERARLAEREHSLERREEEAGRALADAKAEASLSKTVGRAELDREFASKASTLQLDRAHFEVELARLNATKEAHAVELASARADREALLEAQEELAAARGRAEMLQTELTASRAELSAIRAGAPASGGTDAGSRLALLAKEASAANQALVSEQQALFAERQKRKAAKAAFAAERDTLRAELARHRQAQAVWHQERAAWERQLDAARAATAAAEGEKKLVYDQKEELTRRLEELRLDLAAAQRDLESGRTSSVASYAAQLAGVGARATAQAAASAPRTAPAPAAAEDTVHAADRPATARQPAKHAAFTGIMARLEALEECERGNAISTQEFRVRLEATRRRAKELREGAAKESADSIVDQLRYTLAEEGIEHGETSEETLSDDLVEGPGHKHTAESPAGASVNNFFIVGGGSGSSGGGADGARAVGAQAQQQAAAGTPTSQERSTEPEAATEGAPGEKEPQVLAGGSSSIPPLISPESEAPLPPLRSDARSPEPVPAPAAAAKPSKSPPQSPAASSAQAPAPAPVVMSPPPPAPAASDTSATTSSGIPSEINESVPSIVSEAIDYDNEAYMSDGQADEPAAGSAALSVGGVGDGYAEDEPLVETYEEPMDDIGVSPARSEASDW